jgi:hypothetical protein
MEAMLGISLYSYLNSKLAKIRLSYYLLCFLFNKIGEEAERVLSGSGGLGGGVGRLGRGKVAKTVYTHVTKCKNNKRRKNHFFHLIFLKCF